MKNLLILAAALTFALSAAAQNRDKVRYQGELNFGFGVGTGRFPENRWGLETVHGVRFGPHLFAGMGLGLHRFTGPELSFVPVFVELKTYFLKRAASPYLAVDAGYAAGIGGDAGGGCGYLCPAFGISLANAKNRAVLFSVGYQMYLDKGQYGNSCEQSVESLSAWLFKVAVSF